MSKIKDALGQIATKLLDETKNKKIVCMVTYAVLGLVSMMMTVLNLITDKGYLTLATGIFTFACIINFFISVAGQKGVKISIVLFILELLVMFSYFLISGNPDGFSAIWICAIPFCSVLFLDRKWGTVLSGVMLVVLVVMLWTPVGDKVLKYEYNESFKMRFPLLFCAFYAIAIFFETLRALTQSELLKMNKFYQLYSSHDQLTHCFNRKGLFEQLESNNAMRIYRKIGVIISDIDFFKNTNDTYGHMAGDKVLQDFADLATSNLNACICRWGGEEFLMVYYDDEVRNDDLERFRKAVEEKEFEYGENKMKITVSIGVYESAEHDLSEFDNLVKKADEALYYAKQNGRNQVKYY